MKTRVMFMAFAFACLPVTSALAAGNPDTGPGCGLGKMVWEGSNSQKHILQQVLQSTTNGTFGS